MLPGEGAGGLLCALASDLGAAPLGCGAWRGEVRPQGQAGRWGAGDVSTAASDWLDAQADAMEMWILGALAAE